MLLSEIGDKEIIDLRDGSKHGQLWDAEMLFDCNTGCIKALLVPDFENTTRFKKSCEYRQLPWDCIVIIGADVIIFRSTV